MGKVETYGAELSTVMRPTDNDTINLSVAYLKAYVAESQMILVHSLRPSMWMPTARPCRIHRSGRLTWARSTGLILSQALCSCAAMGDTTSESFVQDFSYLNPEY